MRRPPTPRPGAARALVIVAVTALVATSGCSTDDGRVLRPPTTTTVTDVPQLVSPSTDPFELASVVTGAGGFAVSSPVVEPGGPLPVEHTCDGAGLSPPLAWTEPPPGTVELAVAVTDRTGFVHWLVTGIDAAAGSAAAGQVPPGGTVAVNGTGAADYFGPCPPTEAPEVYAVTVYALGSPVAADAGADAAAVLAAVESAAIDRARFALTAAGGAVAS